MLNSQRSNFLQEKHMRLLHVDSSILGAHSVSRTLSADIVEAERRRTPGLVVIYRDLAAEPLQHISGEHLAARPGATAELQLDVERGRADLEEFLAADIVVVGVPMYNFSVPSQLKAWIDRISVKGKTFAYSEQGPRGLAGGKRVIVASSRGGLYGAETARAAFDHQETYLRTIFEFFGITDVTFIRAEGVNMPEHRQHSIDTARAAIAGTYANRR
jgi:FMN-dependent NADH-azoreductase